MELKDCSKTKQELVDEYNNLSEEDRKILDTSYEVVSETKAQSDRLQEIIEFSKKMGYKKIGVALCKGLRNYGEQVDKELSKEFEVVSIPCNFAGIIKDEINVTPIKTGEEIACDPIGQSTALNDAKVDMVVKCGFCMGHDLIFSKNIKPYSTALFIKDRKNKHNTTKLFEN